VTCSVTRNGQERSVEVEVVDIGHKR